MNYSQLRYTNQMGDYMPTELTKAMAIQLAAETIRDEMFKLGQHISEADALAMARGVYRAWQRIDVNTTPGAVAQYMRERYQK